MTLDVVICLKNVHFAYSFFKARGFLCLLQKCFFPGPDLGSVLNKQFFFTVTTKAEIRSRRFESRNCGTWSDLACNGTQCPMEL